MPCSTISTRTPGGVCPILIWWLKVQLRLWLSISTCGEEQVSELRVHGSYGTVELVLDGVLLDLAAARRERYPALDSILRWSQACWSLIWPA